MKVRGKVYALPLPLILDATYPGNPRIVQHDDGGLFAIADVMKLLDQIDKEEGHDADA